MKTISVFLIAFILSASAACSQYSRAKYEQPITSATAKLKTTLSSLNLENPESDFTQNMNNKDYRFIGVCGYACFAPGVTNQNAYLVEKYGLRILEGTSDVIEGDEHMKLIEQSTRYAKKYNELLLVKLKDNKFP